MEKTPEYIGHDSAINYATPGTYRSPRRFRGIVIASSIVAALSIAISTVFLCVGVSQLSQAARGIASYRPALHMTAFAIIMILLAVMLAIAAVELRRFSQMGFRLHHIYAFGQVLANVWLYAAMISDVGQVARDVWYVFFVPFMLASIYPILLLALLRTPANLSDKLTNNSSSPTEAES